MGVSLHTPVSRARSAVPRKPPCRRGYGSDLDRLLAGASCLVIDEPGHRYVVMPGPPRPLGWLCLASRGAPACAGWSSEVEVAFSCRRRDLADAVARCRCLAHHIKRGRPLHVLGRLARRPG
jgi:hypothetical protein